MPVVYNMLSVKHKSACGASTSCQQAAWYGSGLDIVQAVLQLHVSKQYGVGQDLLMCLGAHLDVTYALAILGTYVCIKDGASPFR